MDDSTRIEVLMKEYDSLRAEILARTQSRFSVASIVGGAAMIALATDAGGEHHHQILGWIGIVAAVALWLWLGRLIRIAHNGVVRVEHTVNGIANEKLLRWEHDRPAFGPLRLR